MEIIDTLLALVVSMLAVFGLWCAVKFPMEAFFSSGRVVAAIELKNKEDAELLDVLLHEARSAFFRKGMRRIVVLIHEPLLHGVIGRDGVPNEQILELLAYYGADYRVIG
ncbi:MAG: hypothetical protein J6S28_06590 [Clostridia bacterium]|nr:hypothetical protein [Clostridia bacterium]